MDAEAGLHPNQAHRGLRVVAEPRERRFKRACALWCCAGNLRARPIRKGQATFVGLQMGCVGSKACEAEYEKDSKRLSGKRVVHQAWPAGKAGRTVSLGGHLGLHSMRTGSVHPEGARLQGSLKPTIPAGSGSLSTAGHGQAHAVPATAAASTVVGAAGRSSPGGQARAQQPVPSPSLAAPAAAASVAAAAVAAYNSMYQAQQQFTGFGVVPGNNPATRLPTAREVLEAAEAVLLSSSPPCQTSSCTDAGLQALARAPTVVDTLMVASLGLIASCQPQAQQPAQAGGQRLQPTCSQPASSSWRGLFSSRPSEVRPICVLSACAQVSTCVAGNASPWEPRSLKSTPLRVPSQVGQGARSAQSLQQAPSQIFQDLQACLASCKVCGAVFPGPDLLALLPVIPAC